jgi:periplasmic divalent cation tolerance protein
MLSDEKIAVLYTTWPDEDTAAFAAEEVIKRSLAACVNIFPPVRSIYRWSGDINDGMEIVMIVKTVHANKEDLVKALCDYHPYDVPAILSISCPSVLSEFGQWVQQETRRYEE